VLCVDEKTQIQASTERRRALPIYPGRCGTLTHDYKRHGTTTLFAALELAKRRLIARACRSIVIRSVIRFLRQMIEKRRPDMELHLVVDNYSTHKHAKVQSG